jgi:GNAT superfamily N-acetyltransferase
MSEAEEIMQPATSPAPVRFQPLETADQAAPFLGMTYRSFVPLLTALTPDGPAVAIGAFTDQPAGLAVAELKSAETAMLLSIYVVPAARQRGIGTGLVTATEEALVARGIVEVHAVYPSGKESTPFVERLLAQRGWSPPRPRMYLFQATQRSLETLLTASWLRPAELPPEYEFFPWAEHTETDRAVILAGLESGRFPAMLSPFTEVTSIEPAVSLGLRYRGELYGWMIGHRIAPHTIRYTALFVREDIPHKGLGFRMFAESLQRHIALERQFPDATGCWGVLASNPFAAFLQRRLLPYLSDVTFSLTHESSKLLVPEAASP